MHLSRRWNARNDVVPLSQDEWFACKELHFELLMIFCNERTEYCLTGQESGRTYYQRDYQFLHEKVSIRISEIKFHQKDPWANFNLRDLLFVDTVDVFSSYLGMENVVVSKTKFESVNGSIECHLVFSRELWALKTLRDVLTSSRLLKPYQPVLEGK